MASRKNSRNGRGGPEQDIDRYDQVDRNQYGGRDIYSSSSGPAPGAAGRKNGAAERS